MSVDRERGDLVLPPQSAVAGSGYDATGKTPDEIERDISETRAELGVILDQLERKLAPRHLLERGVDMLKGSMSGDGGNKVSETLRGHPVPIVLIGIGVGWLAMSSSGAGRGRLGEYGGALRDRVSGAAQNVRERGRELAGQVRDKLPGIGGRSPDTYPTESSSYAYARQKSGDVMDKSQRVITSARDTMQDKMRRAQDSGAAAWERAGDYAGQASDRLSGARDRLSDLVEEHPIAVGALGFLAGALIAMAVPRSATEERLVEPAGEQIRGQVAGIGREAVDRAQHVAERTVDAAVGAAKEAVNEVGAQATGKTGAKPSGPSHATSPSSVDAAAGTGKMGESPG